MKIPGYVTKITQQLAANGFRCYPVGGCVRDVLLGKEPNDWDLTTNALPQNVLEIFGGTAHPTGVQHGTVSVVSDGHSVEITTMRRDGVYRDSRHPESVVFTDRIEEDLARRDFTVNALALSEDGLIIDVFDGLHDLKNRTLRCVGEARVRFEEDALRILRLLRFAASLGFQVEPETAKAARECRELLKKVAEERIYSELNGLICGDFATQVLLSFPDILGVVIPEIVPCVGFDQRNPHHCYDVWEHTARSVGEVPPNRALRWTMLFHDLGKPSCMSIDSDGIGHFYGHTLVSQTMAETIMSRLHFERKLSESIRAQLLCFDDLFPPERVAVHQEMARRGREVTANLLLTKLADNAAKAPEGLERAQEPWRKAQTIYDQLTREGVCCSIGELAVNGSDMLAIGFRGKAVGAVLQRLLGEVAKEKLQNNKVDIINRATRLFRSGYGRE